MKGKLVQNGGMNHHRIETAGTVKNLNSGKHRISLPDEISTNDPGTDHLHSENHLRWAN
jgi:hypothetical protein